MEIIIISRPNDKYFNQIKLFWKVEIFFFTLLELGASTEYTFMHFFL